MPVNGTTTLAIGKVSQSKSKGQKYVKELNDAQSPEALSRVKPETQPVNNIRPHHKGAI
jgi:hypothetical protein